ncbi:MAG TPA: hypothetical protein VLX91_16410 [Candidatus Acidoferrales bacterium]|nr:hypothetical protein [Candidatus Acidoferrales bacterium]
MNHDDISSLLATCEDAGLAPKYVVNPDTYRESNTSIFKQSFPLRTPPVEYNAGARDIFVVSDLHIAAGRNSEGVYRGTENFFADDSFGRFLDQAHEAAKGNGAVLIINGDIFDFLRVTEYPGKIRKLRFSNMIKRFVKGDSPGSQTMPMKTDVTFADWQSELMKLGVMKSIEELELSISRREKKYGLGTEAFKTVYKLRSIRLGHPVFFDELAKWMEAGHKMIIVKGNHDVEIYWPMTRNYIRLMLAEDIARRGKNQNIFKILADIVLPNVTFVDDSILIDNEFYVEHGHRYDKFTTVLGSPVLEKTPNEINIPFGSFFNRYLINRVELYFPFLDKVRPAGNVLPILMRENFPLAMKVLFQHIPLLIRILFTNWRYVWFTYRSVLLVVLMLLAPFLVAFNIEPTLFTRLQQDISSIGSLQGIAKMIVDQAENVGLLFLSYVLSRLVGWFQISEPSTLEKFARMRFSGTSYRIMTMGHTHNPGSCLIDEKCLFYNTGTWIPVIENSTASVREDKTFTFLHLIRNNDNRLVPAGGVLQRWDDEAGRVEPQLLIESK